MVQTIFAGISMVLLLGALFLSVVCLIGIALLVRALTANQVEVVRALARKVEAQAALAISTAAPAPAPEPVPATPETSGCEGCGNCRSTAQVPEKEQYETLPDGSFVRSADYETRADGKRVRKDRWETGMRNIATILTGPRNEFEIDDLVEKVRVLAQSARADYESGGNGIPGSAPVWGPCPAQCDGGLVVVKGTDTDCPTCEGRGRVVVEPSLVPAEEAK